MAFIDSLRKGIDSVWETISKTTALLVSSLFLIFSLGTFFGFIIAQIPGNHVWILMVPPLLGVIAYYYRTLALFMFLIFLFVIFI